MRSAPSRTAETIAGFLIPPASREQVLGDLRERYAGPFPYLMDLLEVVPCVIWSRIRRTTDPQVLLMEAFVLYMSFLGAAWTCNPNSFLFDESGFLRLALPGAAALAALVVLDAYAIPRKRPPLRPLYDAALAVAFAYLSQGALYAMDRSMALPALVMALGSGMSVLLISGLRILFPPDSDWPQGVMGGKR